jgi:hypothetical protein
VLLAVFSIGSFHHLGQQQRDFAVHASDMDRNVGSFVAGLRMRHGGKRCGGGNRDGAKKTRKEVVPDGTGLHISSLFVAKIVVDLEAQKLGCI